jgi:integrase
MGMGRKRKHRKDLPARVYERSGSLYFVDAGGKWHNLGRNLSDAMQAYAKLLQDPGTPQTLGDVMDRYQREILPTKALSTRKGQERELGLLRAVFGAMRPDDVTPQHVYQYMDRRPPIRANREKSLLSHVYSHAIRWGCAKDNPCRLVKRNAEKPRTRYVTDAEFRAVRAIMPAPMQCAMDLAYLTGLRQGDIIKLQTGQWSDTDGLTVRTGKTGKTLRFAATPDLAAVISECRDLPGKIASTLLIHTRKGTPYSSSGFQSLWQVAMRQAIADGVVSERFTFHDIRAKTASESTDDRMLGHENPATLHRHYKRAPVVVQPLDRGKILEATPDIGNGGKKKARK